MVAISYACPEKAKDEEEKKRFTLFVLHQFRSLSHDELFRLLLSANYNFFLDLHNAYPHNADAEDSQSVNSDDSFVELEIPEESLSVHHYYIMAKYISKNMKAAIEENENLFEKTLNSQKKEARNEFKKALKKIKKLNKRNMQKLVYFSVTYAIEFGRMVKYEAREKVGFSHFCDPGQNKEEVVRVTILNIKSLVNTLGEVNGLEKLAPLI